MPLQTRYFSFDDLNAAQGWQLVEWCHAEGADEFTLEGLSTPVPSDRMRAFFAALEPFSRPKARRRLLTGTAEGVFDRDIELWRLEAASIDLLRREWAVGPVSKSYDEDLWLEDLIVYRDGDLMMGVVSHEGGGVLRATELELMALRRTGFPDRDEVPWVGY